MQKRSVTDKIPVFVVTGHLGSGKTSLINNLLTQSSGLRIGVIVNDFGDINIDSMLVDKYSEELVSLSNGCLCCSLANELDDSLDQLATSASSLDLILIEASGVADSYQMSELLFNSQNPFITFCDLIYVVDGANWLDFYQQQTALATASLKASRLIILNKIDLIDPTTLAEVEATIYQHQPKAIIHPATHGKIDLQLLVDQSSQPLAQLKLIDYQATAASNYTKFSFRQAKPLDPLKLTAFLNNLPTNVYRLKGWFYCGKKSQGYRLLVQIVGGQHTIQVESEKPPHPQTELVAIGTDFSQSELTQKLIDCIDQNPDQVTPENSISLEYFEKI